MKVRFRGKDQEVQFSKYPNGRLAIVVGDDFAVATVNVPDVPLGAKQVLIKDYSENAGMLAALQEAGIIRRTGESVRTGFVALPVCEVIVPIPEMQKEQNRQVPAPKKQRGVEMER